MDEQGTNDADELTLAPATVVSRTRPKALWGVLAAVAVAAGALAVTSSGDDAAAPLLPVALGAGGGGRQAEPAAADSSLAAWLTYVAGPDLPALGGDAPAYRLPGTVDAAQVQALADALDLDGEIVQDGDTWTVTGADGANLSVYQGGGATWWYSSVSPDTPIGRPAVGGGEDCIETTVGEDAVTCAPATTLAPMPPVSTDCVTPEGGIAACAEPPPDTVDCAAVEAGDCPGEVPAPPVDLPSEDQARAIARDLIAATGVGTDDAVLTVDGPYDAWYVTVEPRLDGVPSGLLANVSVGSGGAITTAGGTLGTPERLGDYPRLDTRAAIDRLNEQMVSGVGWSSGPAAVATDGATREAAATSCADDPEAVTTIPCEDLLPVPDTTIACKVQPDGRDICELPTCPDVAAPADGPLTSDQAIECPLVDPVPVPMPMPEPEPEPMEVVLTAATPALLLLPANDGSPDAYLVPAYRFTGEAGEQVDAPAVADASLTAVPTTEPPVTGTVTVTAPVDSIVPDPGGTDGGGSIGGDPGCEPLVEEDGSGTTHTIQPCVGVDPTDPTDPVAPTTTGVAEE